MKKYIVYGVHDNKIHGQFDELGQAKEKARELSEKQRGKQFGVAERICSFMK